MARQFKTALVITGDARGGVQAIRATERELSKLEQQSRRTIATNKAMQSAYSGARTAALAAAGGIAGMAAAVSVGAVARYTTQVIDTTAKLGNLADAAGIGSEALQEMLFAAQQFDSDFQLDDMADALATVADRAQSATSGSDSAVQSFDLLGISVDQLRGKNPEQLFTLLARGIANTSDATDRLAAVSQILGDDLGRKLLPVLSQGADGLRELRREARDAGAVLDSELVQTAQEADRRFAELTATISTSFKRAILNATDYVGDFGSALSDALNIGEQPIEEGLIERLDHLERLQTSLERVPKGSTVRDTVKDEIADTEQEIENLRAKLALAGLNARASAVIANRRQPRPGAPDGGNADAGGLTDQISAAEQLREQYTDLTASLSKQITLFGDTSEAAKLRYRVEFGDLAKLSDAKKQHLLDMADELQGLRDQKSAVEALFPALSRLKDLKAQADTIDGMGGNLGNLARKQMQSQLGSIATSGAPGMVGLDAVVGGAFGEVNRLERERQQYQLWYDQRLAMLREFTNAQHGVQAQATAALDQLNQQHQIRTQTYETQTQKARLAGYSSLFGNLTDLAGTFAGEQSDIYKALFVAEKSFSIASAIMSIKTGIANAFALPFPENLAAAATVAAETASIVSTIQSVSLAGQAHDGIDSVPRQGTWLLDRGERVVDRRTNADLKEHLSRMNATQGGAQGRPVFAPTVHVAVKAQPGVSPADANRQGRVIGQAVRAEFERLVVDEKRPGGLLSDAG